MGTNYYHSTNVCPHCGRGDEPKHIGKSSMGWVFALHVYPDEGINDIDDWERVWGAGGQISNEYGEKVTVEDMRLTILARARPERWHEPPGVMYSTWDEFHRKNQSERGPAGLLRAQISRYCVKHGAGTYDCHVGDFS